MRHTCCHIIRVTYGVDEILKYIRNILQKVGGVLADHSGTDGVKDVSAERPPSPRMRRSVPAHSVIVLK